MSEQTLDEYVRVTKTIENIQNKINRYKIHILENIEESKSDKEQEEKLKEFRKTMKRIKGDKEITQQYRMLKIIQKELRDKLIPDSSSLNEAEVLIIKLREKYVRMTKNQIVLVDDNEFDNIQLDAKRSLQNIRFEMILNDIQKNLKQDELKYNADSFDIKSMDTKSKSIV